MSRPTVVPRIVLMVVLLAGAGAARGDSLFSSEVKVGDTVVGTFAVDIYKGFYVPPTETSQGSFGISIQGGFIPSGDYTPPDGYEYRWIQTVSTSIPAYSWQVADGVYVDRTRDDGIHARSNTPFYGDGIVTPTPPYALPFADNPSRVVGPAEFHGTWDLSLVLVQPGSDPQGFNQAEPGSNRAIYQLVTFAWGFDAVKQADGSMTVTLHDLQQIPVDPNLLASVFATDPDHATFGGGAWVIQGGLPGAPPTAIPEPASHLLALSAIVAVAVPTLRRRDRRAV